MGRQQARRVADHVQLDTLIRLRRYGPPVDSSTGNPATLLDDVQLWAAIEDQRSVRDRSNEGTTLVFPSAVVIRWDARFEPSEGFRLEVNLPASPGRDDIVSNIERIGRRRFLRLEVEA